MQKKYLGSLFGTLQNVEFKNFKVQTCNKAATLKTYICQGLKEAAAIQKGPRYVSFFVVTKHGIAQTSTENHLNFHMCVYTVRSYEGKKNCIYYDPSAECFKHHIPQVIRDLPSPKMTTTTRIYGEQSQSEDCVYQCMKYVIALHTGQTEFRPDLQQKHFKYQR